MTASPDLKTLEQWCEDAITLLPTPELPPSFAELRRDMIRRNSGKRALYEIAADLAEGLNALPSRKRHEAQEILLSRYGFGYELFTESKLKRVRSALKRGRIKDELEYGDLLDFASDTTNPAELRNLCTKMLADYEAGHQN